MIFLIVYSVCILEVSMGFWKAKLFSSSSSVLPFQTVDVQPQINQGIAATWLQHPEEMVLFVVQAQQQKSECGFGLTHT